MEEKKTVQYKRTLRGTMGAGASALFNGGGRRYYVLEHRDSSKYHKAGESQKIIVDQAELGRSADCQVRFDETFETVSRRHAAIVREDDRWKLVQLSTVNSTFLNGRPVESQWYLENGDEIQLSVGGPRLGFIVPEGKQGLVSSIRLTERMELFRKQALRPYKRAIVAMTVFMLIAIGSLGAWNIMLQNDLRKQSEELAGQTKRLEGDEKAMDSLNQKLVASNGKIGDLNKEIDRLRKRGGGGARPKPIPTPPAPDPNPDVNLLNECTKDVYFIFAAPCINGEPLTKYGWTGTGFLLNNGRFVTAQHMVHFDDFGITIQADTLTDNEGESGEAKRVVDSENPRTMINAMYYASMLTIKMFCISSTGSFELEYTYSDNPFTCGKANREVGSFKDDDGRFWNIFVHNYSGGDWAYTTVNQSGGLDYDSEYSKNLPINTKLHIFGFPSNQAVKAQGKISPICSQAVTSRAGLEDEGIIKTSNDDADEGNSGGPVLTAKKGKYVVVGIYSGVNFGSDRSHRKGRIIPIGSAM